MKNITGVLLASTVCVLFASTVLAATTPATPVAVKCMGGNACKGLGACKTATNSCKGQNSCKGKGFVMANSATDCTNAGGTVITK